MAENGEGILEDISAWSLCAMLLGREDPAASKMSSMLVYYRRRERERGREGQRERQRE
jgi:hypothetical protein